MAARQGRTRTIWKVTVHGVPNVNVLLSTVGLTESQSGRVGGPVGRELRLAIAAVVRGSLVRLAPQPAWG